MRQLVWLIAAVMSVGQCTVFAGTPRVPENPTGTQPGVYYQYYATSGSGGTLPDFTQILPVTYDVINNFSLTPALSTTNFSFQYTGYVTVPATGTYTFYTSSDDGSRLYIGTTLVVDNNFSQAQTERSGTISLQAGTHALTVQYGQGGGGYGLSVSYDGPTITKTTIPDSALSTIPPPPPPPRTPENPVGTVQGLLYQFYTNSTPDGTLPIFTAITPAKTGTINNFLLDPRTTDTSIAFQYKGYVSIPTTGLWTFFTTSDDGSRLFIGTTLVVDNNYAQGMTERSGAITLAAGVHALTVQYAQGVGGFGLEVRFQGPSGSNVAKQQIPDSSLSYLPLTATPVISPTNFKIPTPTFDMSLTCATPSATIYYTTDGSNPTTASTVYSNPVTLSTLPVTVKALALAPNFDSSFIAVTNFVTALPPANDNFANAILLSGALPTVATGANYNATWEAGEPNHGDGDGQKSIWYRWVAPSTGSYQFSTAGSAIDTTMGVYTGSAVNALTTLGENDDQNDSAVNTLGLNAVTNSYVAISATAGTTYYIAIDGFGGAEGTTQLTISQGPVISVVATTPNASETGPVSGVFTLTRTGNTSAVLQVNFSLSGTATKGLDYNRIDEFVALGAGQTSATVTITPKDNFVSDGTRTVNLTLSPDNNYSVNQAQSVATVNIADNDALASGTVKAVSFSVNHGFYAAPIDVTISSATPGASFRYTLNGTQPTPTSGTVYATPLHITSTTTLRVIGYKTGMNPTVVATQTYLFTGDIVNQSSTSGPPGWPASWGANTVHYGMDPNIVTNAKWSGTIQNDLKTIPSLCVSVKLGDLFDPSTGIYANAQQDSYAWERPISLELIDPNNASNSFSELCGIRIRGGFSRDPSNPKHAFRIFFRKDYNKGNLNFPLFGTLPAQQQIDKFDIRCDQNYSWSFQGDRGNECFMRDNFSRASQMVLSGQGTRGTYYHLYINGVYWGLYNTEERPEATFGAWYFGGVKDDYDTIKTSNDNGYDIEATDGNLDAWTRLWKQCKAGLSTNDAYFRIQGRNPDGTPNPRFENLVEIDQLIDYMLVIYYGGNLDSPISQFLSNQSPNNIFFQRDRNGNAGFRFFTHDAEHTLLDVNQNRLGPWPAGDTLAKSNPQWVCQQCMSNAEFRLKFADHVRTHFFNNGAMTPAACLARFTALQSLLDRAVVPESARWGDSKTSPACTRDDWLAVCNNIINNYFPYRTQIVINQFMAANLYPGLSAPAFSQYGGNINPGFVCTVTNPNATGRVYYTIDGSDPRLVGGGISPAATAGGTTTTLVSMNGTLTLRTRVLDGSNWSALTESTFIAPQDFSTLKVTEIMYNPPDFQGIDGQQFEFIELKNTGSVALNLSGAQFVSGIGYTFPSGAVLSPGQIIVLCNNPADFALKYPAVTPYGTYTGQLNNSGDTITLNYSTGVTIFSLTYNDAAPWPVAADGLGFSLVPYNPATMSNFSDPKNWRASANPGGSPGADDPTPAINGTALINEALTHIDAGGHEYIELYNPGSSALDVTGWYLTDDRHTPMKFKIPAGSVIPAGGTISFSDVLFNSQPGVAPSFALDSHGEEVFVFSADQAGLNLTGYSHGFTFGAAEDNVAFGRYVISTGDEHFVAQTANTPGAQNAGPRVGPVVFSEVMYQPATGGDEFIELLNITTGPVNLYDPLNPANTWQITGINFTFPQNVQLPAQGLALVVPISPTTFRTKYNVPAGVQIFGPYTTPLADSGMTIELQKPGTPDTSVPYIRVDWLSYTHAAPWPQEPAGNGPSLARIDPLAYGNDPINWKKSSVNGGSPGQADALTPAAPAGLGLTVFSSTQINLAWTDAALNETSYTVQRSPNGLNGWTTIAPLGANVVSYPDIGLSPANTYYYRVYCSNAFGDSPFSNIASAQTLTPPPPNTPQALVVLTYSQSKLNLQWDTLGGGETGFKIERSLDGLTGWTEIGQSPAGVVTYQDTGLMPSTLYYYRVRSFNPYGNSNYSTMAQGKTSQARIVKGRVNGPLVRGHNGSIFVDLDSAGGENSVAFSLSYDPTLLANPVILKGVDAGANTTLTTQTSANVVGATLAFVDLSSFGPGVKALVEIRFDVLVSGQAATTAVQFSDTPVARAILDYTATALEVSYQDISPTISPNTPPAASDGSLTATEDLPATGTLSATDAESDALTYSVVAQAGKGTVTITNAATGAFTYTPILYVNGSDSFTFKANDGLADSNVATVMIAITPVNHAPVAQNGTLNTTEELAAQGTLSANDVDNDALTFSVVAQPPNGTVTITNAATGSYTYTPKPLTYGPDSFTFKANDGTIDSNTATILIAVTHVNHAPVAQNRTLNTLEDISAPGTLAGR